MLKVVASMITSEAMLNSPVKKPMEAAPMRGNKLVSRLVRL